ncbi:MAG: hypothetical protein ACR2NP_22560 [Pirellulaceae bacterium]
MKSGNFTLLRRLIFLWVTGCGIAMCSSGLTAQELTRRASWQPPTPEQVTEWVDQWAKAANQDAEPLREQLESLANTSALLPTTLRVLQECFPHTATTIDKLQVAPETSLTSFQIIDPAVFVDSRLPESARIQLQLAAGCWYARHQRYDEALELLTPLPLDQTIDPAALLFHISICQHRLIQVDPCVSTINQLMENEKLLPRRYAAVASLMLSDIETLETDSLDEIARMMADIRRRQALHRSGTRVIGQEQEVIDKLDKMIEELEKQLQQQQQQAAASSQGAQPMQDSQNAGGQGQGNVTDRQIAEGGSWGSLPPQKRAAALAEMARDLPPHYREVIEEYFRQLAREDQ